MLGHEIALNIFRKLQVGEPSLITKNGEAIFILIAPFGEAGSVRFIRDGISVRLGVTRKALQAPHDPVELEISYESPSRGPVVTVSLGVMDDSTYVEIIHHYKALWSLSKDYQAP